MSQRDGRSATERTSREPAKPARPPRERVKPARDHHPSRWVPLYWLLGAAVLLVVIGAAYWTPLKVYYRELREATVARTQLIEVREHNEALRAEIESLETTAGIEEYARRSLGLVKQGDHSIVVYQNGEPISNDGDAGAKLINESDEVKRPFGAWTPFLDRLLLSR